MEILTKLAKSSRKVKFQLEQGIIEPQENTIQDLRDVFNGQSFKRTKVRIPPVIHHSVSEMPWDQTGKNTKDIFKRQSRKFTVDLNPNIRRTRKQLVKRTGPDVTESELEKVSIDEVIRQISRSVDDNEMGQLEDVAVDSVPYTVQSPAVISSLSIEEPGPSVTEPSIAKSPPAKLKSKLAKNSKKAKIAKPDKASVEFPAESTTKSTKSSPKVATAPTKVGRFVITKFKSYTISKFEEIDQKTRVNLTHKQLNEMFPPEPMFSQMLQKSRPNLLSA